jgi:hypothetical protein
LELPASLSAALAAGEIEMQPATRSARINTYDVRVWLFMIR